MTHRKERETAIGAAGVAGLTIALLLWLMYGEPSLEVVQAAKWPIGGASLFLSWQLWRRTPMSAPLSLILLAIASLNFESTWLGFEANNGLIWVQMATLGIAAGLVFPVLPVTETTPEETQKAPDENAEGN